AQTERVPAELRARAGDHRDAKALPGGAVSRLACISLVVCAVLSVPRPSAAREPLGPEAVLSSSERHHPRIVAALVREEIAEAELRAARGGFDPQLSARGAVRTGGYYDLRRVDAEIRQPTPVW